MFVYLYLVISFGVMEGEILNIETPITFDESIAHCEIHAHRPYASSTFNNSDEIRISVQHQDLCLLPSRSSFHVNGKLTLVDGNPVVRSALISNAICHLFEEARYELNGTEIDKTKNLGLTSVMKNYVSMSPGQSRMMENAGWLEFAANAEKLTNENCYFDIVIPLGMIFGFAEDYHKIIVNAKHELILVRSKSDANAIIQTAPDELYKISIEKVEWLLPYVKLSDQRKMKLLKYIERDNPIRISFRTWENYQFPLLPTTTKYIWTVKTSTWLEKPRFIIFGFQTNRKNNVYFLFSLAVSRNWSHFDHCNISDIKLFLNSQSYPYGNLNLDIEKNQYALLYEMYSNFQAIYYGKESQPLLSKKEFLNYAPLTIIDCSKQNESLKFGPVDIRLEFEARTAFTAQTSAYCLILHNRIIEYTRISGMLKKLI